jgi:hypothetical protein
MRRGRPSGWQLTTQLKTPWKLDEVVPTAWELFLKETKLTEKEAIRHPKARDWVRINCRRSFVPEAVLEAMGMDVSFDWGDA